MAVRVGRIRVVLDEQLWISSPTDLWDSQEMHLEYLHDEIFITRDEGNERHDDAPCNHDGRG